MAGQLDVISDHGLSLDAAVWFGGWHCAGEGRKRRHDSGRAGDGRPPPQSHTHAALCARRQGAS